MTADPSIKNWFANKRLIFWDFDGVIKDSVTVKTQAYIELFSHFGDVVCDRVRTHHAANGGMSRFEKLPMYLSWAGVKATNEIVNAYCARFRELCFRGVIESAWVPGVEHILLRNPFNQSFVLVTATPEGEINEILEALNLTPVFWRVIGAPTSKKAAIASGLRDSQFSADDALVVGDSFFDFEAAEVNKTEFLLRKTRENETIFHEYKGKHILDFREILE